MRKTPEISDPSAHVGSSDKSGDIAEGLGNTPYSSQACLEIELGVKTWLLPAIPLTFQLLSVSGFFLFSPLKVKLLAGDLRTAQKRYAVWSWIAPWATSQEAQGILSDKSMRFELKQGHHFWGQFE